MLSIAITMYFIKYIVIDIDIIWSGIGLEARCTYNWTIQLLSLLYILFFCSSIRRDDWCIPINVCRNSWPRRETLDFWSSYHFLGCLSAATTQTTTTHYKSLLLHSRLSHRITPHHTLPCNVATQFELYTSYIIHLIGLNRIQSNSHYCYSSHRGTYLTTVAEAATSIAAMTSGFRNQAYHKPLSSGKS